MRLFKDLYQYRELLKTNIQKEVRGKYKGAWLGILWSYLNPLLMLIVYSVVFTKIMRLDIPNYSMFLFSGLLAWNFFSTTMSSGAYSVISQGGIIKKVYFPREIIPISVVTSNLINFLISCLIMLIFLFITGIGISYYILLFPVILIIQYLLLLGLAFIVSSITVYARDMEHLINVFLMALFYGTPVLYSIDMIPNSILWLINLNPMAHIINAYRSILFYKEMPDLFNLSISFVMSLLIFVFGLWIFRKLQRNFAEEL